MKRNFILQEIAWWLILVTLCLGLLLVPEAAQAQDIYIPSCSTSYSCSLTANQFPGGVPWATGNQTFVFAPIAPNASIYFYLHNRNTTNGHTPAFQVFQTGSTVVSNLSASADQWVQDSVTQNTVANASCNSVAAAAPATPGASGTGTCYVITMAAAQVAVKITGATAAAGSPDTYDLNIVQITSSPGGPQPGQSGYVVATTISPTNPADATSNTSIPGVQGFDLLFNGATWDRARSASLANQPTSNASTTSQSSGLAMVEKGPRWSFNGLTAGTSQTSSIAAIANVRHVIDCYAWTFGVATAPGANGSVSFLIQDGITTIWQEVFEIATTTAVGTQYGGRVCGLSLTGTTNSAMTCSSQTSTTATGQVSVSCSGYDVK